MDNVQITTGYSMLGHKLAAAPSLPMVVPTPRLVDHIYAVKGKTDPLQAARIFRRTSIPNSWVDEIPQSKSNGTSKLSDERNILVLVNRVSPFIEQFKHLKGRCYPFYKLTAYNNCNFWCEYCYLYMTFYMRPQSIHFINYDKMFAEIEEFSKKRVAPKFQMLNLGELSDPLAVDDITGFSKEIIPFVSRLDNVKLLFLTKSATVDNLLGLEHKNKTVLAWSLNADTIVDMFEHKTPSSLERIEAAKKAQEHGYEIRFRIDPIFLFSQWQEEYRRLVDRIFDVCTPTMITLGEYRPTNGLINHIKTRFPGSKLIEVEKNLKLDAGKKRYHRETREMLYSYIIEQIRRRNKSTQVSLCKECGTIWKQMGLNPVGMNCNCTNITG